jgi:hypothetical protein
VERKGKNGFLFALASVSGDVWCRLRKSPCGADTPLDWLCPRANPTRQLKGRKIDVNLVLLYPEVSYSQHDQVQDGFSGRAGL